MAEYIDKNEPIEEIKRIYCTNCDSYNGVMCKACDHQDDIDIIDDTKAADVQSVDRWISVKDRLPEIGKSVLLYYPYWDGDEIQVAKLEVDEMMFDVCGEFNIRVGAVTHWMPLPEPPKDGEI